MKLVSLIKIIGLSSLISACGGNDDKVTNSASSSSVSSGVKTCASFEGGVFIDYVCPAWHDVSIFEINKETSVYQFITDGSNGNMISREIVDSSDAGHYQVISVVFNDSPDFNGNIQIPVASLENTGVDMSEYAEGKIIFDIKRITNGEFSPKLEVQIECSWPCTSAKHQLNIPNLNEWITIQIDVAELIVEGLDITRVFTGFWISPEWGQQNGVEFQLDNIHWVRGAE